MVDIIKNRIYVGHLNECVGEADLRKFLRGYGDIKEIVLMRGFAFVEFEENSDAEDAINELNGSTINGDTVTVRFATAPKRNDGRRQGENYRAKDDEDFMGRGDGRDGNYLDGERRGKGRPLYDPFSAARPNHGANSYRGRRYHDSYSLHNRQGCEDRDRSLSSGQLSKSETYSNDGEKNSAAFYGPLLESPWRVRIKYLPDPVSWQDLKDFMRQAGEVTFASAHQPRRNEGLAEYATKEAMQRALDELDGAEMHGTEIKVIRDTESGRGKGGRGDAENNEGSGADSMYRYMNPKNEGNGDWWGGGRGGGGDEDWSQYKRSSMRGRGRGRGRAQGGKREAYPSQETKDNIYEMHMSKDLGSEAETEGPGEGCYSVCLSKEIKKLHEEINAIVPPEIGPITVPGFEKVEKTTRGNSEKLDELLKVVQNITAESGSSEIAENLRQQLEEAKATIVELRKERLELVAKGALASKEISALKDQINDLEKSLDNCENQLNKTVDELQRQVAEHLVSIAELEAENRLLREQLESSQGVVGKLQRDLSAAKKVVEETRERVGNLTTSLNEANEKLSESNKLVKNLTKSLADEKAKADANQKLVEELAQNLKDAKEEKKEVQKQVDALTKDLFEEKAKLKVAEERVKDLEARLEQELEKAKQCEASLQKLKTKLAEEKAKADRCGTAWENAKKELADQKAEAKRLEGQLGKCQADMTQAAKDAQAKLENAENELDKLRREKASLTKDLAACKQKELELSKKISDLEIAVKAKQTQLDQVNRENKNLKGDIAAKNDEITKLKKDLKDALENASSGDEVKQLKEENKQLKKKNEDAMKKIRELEEEILILNKGRQPVPVKFEDATFGATSESPFSEADKAFTDDHYASWTSSDQAPQTIWVQFQKALRLTRFSFKASVAPENGASKFELIATNDAMCHEYSNWDIIYQDLSGKGFASDEETMVAQVDACKMYKCYGIRVLDVNNIEGQKWVIMSEIKMWARE